MSLSPHAPTNGVVINSPYFVNENVVLILTSASLDSRDDKSTYSLTCFDASKQVVVWTNTSCCEIPCVAGDKLFTFDKQGHLAVIRLDNGIVVKTSDLGITGEILACDLQNKVLVVLSSSDSGSEEILTGIEIETLKIDWTNQLQLNKLDPPVLELLSHQYDNSVIKMVMSNSNQLGYYSYILSIETKQGVCTDSIPLRDTCAEADFAKNGSYYLFFGTYLEIRDNNNNVFFTTELSNIQNTGELFSLPLNFKYNKFLGPTSYTQINYQGNQQLISINAIPNDSEQRFKYLDLVKRGLVQVDDVSIIFYNSDNKPVLCCLIDDTGTNGIFHKRAYYCQLLENINDLSVNTVKILTIQFNDGKPLVDVPLDQIFYYAASNDYIILCEVLLNNDENATQTSLIVYPTSIFFQ